MRIARCLQAEETRLESLVCEESRLESLFVQIFRNATGKTAGVSNRVLKLRRESKFSAHVGWLAPGSKKKHMGWMALENKRKQSTCTLDSPRKPK